MATIVITCNLTVDGLIESPVPVPDGWLVFEGDSEQRQFDEFEAPAALLLGRKSYEGFAGYWPTAAGDGRWADRLNPMRKFVASTTLRGPLDWNATLIDGDVATGIQQLKTDLDGKLVVSGTGSFARFLVENGLVDEVRFWVQPSVQGPGERPFHDGPPIQLDLIDAEKLDSGVALLRYRPASS